MEALSKCVSELDIQQNSESAIRLGKYLIKSEPDYFREGAWLMALNNKSEIFDAVAEKVKRKIDVSHGFCSVKKREEIIDYAYILMKLSEDKARRFLLAQIQRDIYDYLRVHMATVLLSVEDCSGYEILMDEMMKSLNDGKLNTNLSHEMDRFLSNSTPGEYYPRNDPQAMYLWYQKHKKDLLWDNKKYRMIHSKKL